MKLGERFGGTIRELGQGGEDKPPLELGKRFGGSIRELGQAVELKAVLMLGEQFGGTIRELGQAVELKAVLMLGERFGGSIRELGQAAEAKVPCMLGQDLSGIVVDRACTTENDLIWIFQESLGHSKVDMIRAFLFTLGAIIGIRVFIKRVTSLLPILVFPTHFNIGSRKLRCGFLEDYLDVFLVSPRASRPQIAQMLINDYPVLAADWPVFVERLIQKSLKVQCAFFIDFDPNGVVCVIAHGYGWLWFWMRNSSSPAQCGPASVMANSAPTGRV